MTIKNDRTGRRIRLIGPFRMAHTVGKAGDLGYITSDDGTSCIEIKLDDSVHEGRYEFDCNFELIIGPIDRVGLRRSMDDEDEDEVGAGGDGTTAVYPDNNPKALSGSLKIPLDLVPPALALGVAEAMADGAKKYGAYNYRTSKIAANVYKAAIDRHMGAWWDGEDDASDSGIHHLKHVAACLAIMLDSMACGTFDDNRPPSSGAAEIIAQYRESDNDDT